MLFSVVKMNMPLIMSARRAHPEQPLQLAMMPQEMEHLVSMLPVKWIIMSKMEAVYLVQREQLA